MGFCLLKIELVFVVALVLGFVVARAFLIILRSTAGFEFFSVYVDVYEKISDCWLLVLDETPEHSGRPQICIENWPNHEKLTIFLESWSY